MTVENPIAYHGLDHVVLMITDIAQSLAFYVDILGLTLERVIEDASIYQLRCGRHLIDLQVLPPGVALAEGAARGIGHVCVLVRGELGAIVEYLRQHSVPISFGPAELYGATGFGSSVYINDPDGHTLEIKADGV